MTRDEENWLIKRCRDEDFWRVRVDFAGHGNANLVMRTARSSFGDAEAHCRRMQSQMSGTDLMPFVELDLAKAWKEFAVECMAELTSPAEKVSP